VGGGGGRKEKREGGKNFPVNYLANFLQTTMDLIVSDSSKKQTVIKNVLTNVAGSGKSIQNFFFIF
jgi:hypothetical protein